MPFHIEIKGTVSNETCENCHTKQRQVTASGDLKVPHAKHIDVKGVACVDCHSSVAHAGIASRFEDLAHNSDELAARAAHMEAKDFRPSMETCIGCHNQQKVVVDCESCHKEIKTPVNHERPEWKLQHGSEGLVQYNECLFCHDITRGKQVVNETRQPSAIRENDTCLDCHLKRPPAHDASWVLGHGRVAAGGKAACLVCHDEERKPGSKAEKVVACAQCHNSNHSGNWIKEHPGQVKQAGMGQCFTCHDAKSCSSCHVQRGVGRR